MTELETRATCEPKAQWFAGVQAWLAARPRGRWATTRGRWVQVVLTMCLVLAGLSAWALALVQPWTSPGGDCAAISLAGGMDTGRIRAAAADVEKLCGDTPDAAPAPLRRNPFLLGTTSESHAVEATQAAAHPAAPAAEPPAVAEKLPAPAAPAPAAPAAQAGAMSATAILNVAKGLKLEITLIAPSGERWAVINGKNYRAGDTVAGLEIVEIQEGKVKLQQAGAICLLRMD
jgi:hypothetical protein